MSRVKIVVVGAMLIALGAALLSPTDAFALRRARRRGCGCNTCNTCGALTYYNGCSTCGALVSYGGCSTCGGGCQPPAQTTSYNGQQGVIRGQATGEMPEAPDAAPESSLPEPPSPDITPNE